MYTAVNGGLGQVLYALLMVGRGRVPYTDVDGAGGRQLLYAAINDGAQL